MTIFEGTPLHQLRRFRKDLALHKLEKFWEISLPGLDSAEVKSILHRFVQSGAKAGELAAMLDKAKSMDDLEKGNLIVMTKRGLDPHQIHLFIQSTPDERKLLTEEWRTDLVAKLKRAVPHTPQAVGLATTTGLVGGAIGCLAFMSMTLMTQDASFFEAGRALLGAIASPEVGLDSLRFKTPSADRIVETGASVSMGATLTTLLIKSSHTVISELLKSDPQQALDKARRDLEDRARGVFSRHGHEPFPLVGNATTPERALKVLEGMPDSILPILTHLQPKELVVFLEANDATRETMLRTNPPAMEQRIDAIRALHVTKLGRALATARQSLSAWEGPLSNQSTVSLKSSLAAMRGARNAKMGLIQPSPSTQRPAMG